MQYQFFPYIYFLAFSAVMTLFLAVFSASRLKASGQTAFGFWMLICSYWSICNAFELMGTKLPVKLFWANMQYAAYSLFPVCLFVLTLQLIGHMQRPKLLNIAFLIVIPLITTVLVWFDTTLGLVRYNFMLAQDGGFFYIKKSYGPWFWVHTIYTYGLFLLSFILLARSAVIQKNSLFRKQQGSLLLSIIILFIPNILFVLGVSPVRTFDITPVFFSVTGSLVLWSMFKYRFLDLIPVARETIFENMDAGIIITDISGIIIDINVRAQKMFDVSGSSVVGRTVKEMLPVLFPESIPDHAASAEIYLSGLPEKNGDGRYYERRCTPLTLRNGKNAAGWMFSVSDVTDLHAAQEKVFQQQQELAVSAEQQRVARDLHDNIGQILSFAGIQIQTIQHELEKGNAELAAEYLDKLKDVTDQSYADLRTYIFNLRQPAIQNVPFKKMLSDFASQVETAFHISCSLDLPEQIPHFFDSSEVKSHLFSLTKEAVNNCIKHANASKICIGISVSGICDIVYFIEDNGSGIAPQRLSGGSVHSSGIRIMEERALLTGGRLGITSAPGKGTRIEVVYNGEKE